MYHSCYGYTNGCAACRVYQHLIFLLEIFMLPVAWSYMTSVDLETLVVYEFMSLTQILDKQD